MKSKLTVLPLIVLIAVLALPGLASAPQAAAQVKGEVMLYSAPGADDWYNYVIDEFKKVNPDITVNLVVTSWEEFDTKMIAMNAAGTPPDIWTTWGPSGFRDYVAKGLVADLTPYVERDGLDLSDFVPQTLEWFTIDGKLYGIPHTLGAGYLFYNKDMFDAAGLEYPPTDWNDTSWTWDAMLEMCSKLAYYVPGDITSSTWCVSQGLYPDNTYAWLWGVDMFPEEAYTTGYATEANLSDPLLLEAFQQYMDITYKYHYDQTGPEFQASGGSPFRDGKTAMLLWGVWGFDEAIKVTDFEWGIAALPYGRPDVDRKVAVFANPWMMSSQSKNPDAAWEFLKFLTSYEMQLDFQKRGSNPPARLSLNEAFYANIPYMTTEEIEEVLQGALEHGRVAPNNAIVGWNEINQMLSTALDPIDSGTAAPADVLPAWEDDLTELLKEIQEQYNK